MTDVVAIIPARSGSKSIQDKNLAQLCGFPLLAYSIAVARLSQKIERVIVSTDSSKYAEVAKSYGAEVPFIRPDELATDTSTDREFMLHAMNWLQSHEGCQPEFWVHLRPTTPLREPRHVDKAITLMMGNPTATSLRSAHQAPESPFKWFRRNEQGCWTALTTDNSNLDEFNLPRQAYPKVFVPDGYVDIVRSSFVLSTSLLHGDRVVGYESPCCTEVDSPEELEHIDFQLAKYGSPLLNSLKENRKY